MDYCVALYTQKRLERISMTLSTQVNDLTRRIRQALLVSENKTLAECLVLLEQLEKSLQTNDIDPSRYAMAVYRLVTDDESTYATQLGQDLINLTYNLLKK